jgi:hypothetical protein
MIHQMSDNHLVLEKQLEFNSNLRIVALDIADINGNGFPEIFVTSLTIHLDKLQSFVVEYNGADYVTIADNQHYYYRVLDGPDGARTLMGQRTGKDPFDGPVYIMRAEGSSYTRQKEVRLPRNTSVLSLAKGPVTNESAEEYVMINRFGRLVMTDDGGSEKWESTVKYGGSAHVWLMTKKDPDASYRDRVYIHPRIQFFDMTGDGAPEILTIQNNTFGGDALGRYKRFKNGTIQVLSWNGIALAPIFQTRALQGWISDFAMADIDADGKEELIVSVVTQTKLAILSKDKTASIISYDLDQ